MRLAIFTSVKTTVFLFYRIIQIMGSKISENNHPHLIIVFHLLLALANIHATIIILKKKAMGLIN